jgi:hypothetical protein
MQFSKNCRDLDLRRLVSRRRPWARPHAPARLRLFHFQQNDVMSTRIADDRQMTQRFNGNMPPSVVTDSIG